MQRNEYNGESQNLSLLSRGVRDGEKAIESVVCPGFSYIAISLLRSFKMTSHFYLTPC